MTDREIEEVLQRGRKEIAERRNAELRERVAKRIAERRRVLRLLSEAERAPAGMSGKSREYALIS